MAQAIDRIDATRTPFDQWASMAGGGTVVIDFSMEAAPTSADTLENVSAAAKGRVVVLAQNLDYVSAVNALGNPRFRAVYSHRFLEMANNAFRAILSDPVKLAALKNRRRPGMTQRHFTCLLNRARPHRLAVFGWLKRRGYLDRGNVSFHGAELMHDAARFKRMQDYGFKQFPSFEDDIRAALDTEFPYSNFRNFEGENFIVSVSIPAYDAPVSLVAESEMSDTTQRFTEKSLKAFMAGHRPLIAGNLGVCGMLSDMGFSFPGFGMSHDTITDANDRLLVVLSDFERYMQLTNGERRDWIEATWADCLENMEAFVARTDAVIRQSANDLADALR